MNDLLLSHGSYLLITIVLILTGSGLPIPEEVPIIAAGVLSANGTLNPLAAYLCCLFGAITGDCIMYFAGYHFGRGVLRDHPWFARFVTPEREAQIEEKFRLHGLKVFFVARFLVGIRSPVYLTAGILRVSFKRFFFIDLFCATVVVGTFFGMTYLFGSNIGWFIQQAELLITVVAVIVVSGAAFFIWHRYRDRIKAALAHHHIDLHSPCRHSPPPKSTSDEEKTADDPAP